MIQIYSFPIGIPTKIISIANNERAIIVTWLKANKLSLNLTKTNFMIFHLRQKKINVYVPLVMENTIIKQVLDSKLFGSHYY